MRETGVVWATAVALMVGLSACAGDAEEADEGGETLAREQGAGGAEVAGSGREGASAVPLQAPAVGPSVIKTAELSVEVDRDGVGGALDAATSVAARYGGFVVSSTTGGEAGRTGSVTLRVPSDRFEEALADLSGLGEVERRRVAGQDVSQEFVDLEARLRNFEAQEAVLLRLFDDAVSIGDTIRVQDELSGVRLRIEEIQGRLRFLRDQTSFGTITVVLTEEGTAARGTFDRAVDRAVDGFLAVVAGLVVGVGYLLPLALLGGLGTMVFRRWRPRPAST
jgi:uncharacterized protein DUF4349